MRLTEDGLAREKTKFIPLDRWELKENAAQRSTENLGLIYYRFFKKHFSSLLKNS